MLQSIRLVSLYLFVAATKFGAEAHKKADDVNVTHVCRPVDRAAIFLIKRVDCRTFLQQQLCHLHATTTDRDVMVSTLNLKTMAKPKL